MDKQKYALGFMFNEDKTKVLLINKNRPDYQKGRLNGLGGKPEEGDENNSLFTMIREFKEESGIYHDKWEQFCELYGDNWSIDVFRAFGDIYEAKNVTDEEVCIVDINDLPENVMGNLHWLIYMALGKDKYIIKEL